MKHGGVALASVTAGGMELEVPALGSALPASCAGAPPARQRMTCAAPPAPPQELKRDGEAAAAESTEARSLAAQAAAQVRP